MIRTVLALIFAYTLIFMAVPAMAWSPDRFKKESKDQLRSRLSSIQYQVTQEEGTERPFSNEFWNNHKDGIYVDVVSGEPLFSSQDKFDSGTGWPSFTKPVKETALTAREDRKLFLTRVEVRSRMANSHLGHVFDDGPKPTGKRYCINSAALRFVPKEKLKESGYGEFAASFDTVKTAIFAGGCFWCMQPPFDALKKEGVIATRVGYSGGRIENPTYEQVSGGDTGHKEVIEVTYDSKKIPYEKLLNVFWHNIDPLDQRGQFCDKGEQYQSAIYASGPEQLAAAKKSLADLTAAKSLPGPIVTQVLDAKKFFPAEDYHQDYYHKNPIRYKFYRSRCGRDSRLERVWGKPNLATVGGTVHMPNIKSGPERVALLELYTSEGCSSCPPADRGFSALKSAPVLWRTVVPVAFHVNYWDYLGWKDALSSSQYTIRQRAYAIEWGQPERVYTPALIHNGAEARLDAPDEPKKLVGTLEVSQTGPARFKVQFDPLEKPGSRRLNIYFALLGMDISRRIGAGENEGKTLSHDFAVLDLQTKTADGAKLEAEFEIKGQDLKSRALAAWVTEPGRLRPIQAAGGFL
jgi:peptide methionine sulfoxide reductase msrA/msrB